MQGLTYRQLIEHIQRHPDKLDEEALVSFDAEHAYTNVIELYITKDRDCVYGKLQNGILVIRG